ncbi:MAG: NrdH-redoxin [Geobacter sp.]|nr:NrdH-redoxin [Geobacter sp.]
MKKMVGFTFLAVLLASFSMALAGTGPVAAGGAMYPEVVIYSTPWCASCKAAMEYLAKNDIPFVKKDVTVDGSYMEELQTRYRSSAVPLIVIGRDEKVLKGFVLEAFQKAYREVVAKRSRSRD